MQTSKENVKPIPKGFLNATGRQAIKDRAEEIRKELAAKREARKLVANWGK